MELKERLNVIYSELNRVEQNILATLARAGICVTEDMHDKTRIPLRTLYSHLKKLEDMGCIEVIREEKVRGTYKKFYRITLLGLVKAWQSGCLTSKETLKYMSEHSKVISILYQLPKFKEEKFVEWISSFVIEIAANQVELYHCADYMTGERHDDEYYLTLLLKEIENQTFICAFPELSNEDKSKLNEKLDKGIYEQLKTILVEKAQIMKQLVESFKNEYTKFMNMIETLGELYKLKIG